MSSYYGFRLRLVIKGEYRVAFEPVVTQGAWKESHNERIAEIGEYVLSIPFWRLGWFSQLNKWDIKTGEWDLSFFMNINNADTCSGVQKFLGIICPLFMAQIVKFEYYKNEDIELNNIKEEDWIDVTDCIYEEIHHYVEVLYGKYTNLTEDLRDCPRALERYYAKYITKEIIRDYYNVESSCDWNNKLSVDEIYDKIKENLRFWGVE